MTRARGAIVCALLALAAACSSSGGSSAPPPPADAGPSATTLGMRFDRSASFYAAPFPSDDLRNADGSIAIAGFPNPNGVALVQQATALLAKDARGFALEGGVFFAASAPLDPKRLPDRATTITPPSTVFLIGTDPAAPDYLQRYPVDVAFAGDGGDFGAPNLLSLLPLQGVPLRPKATYAAVVMRALGDASGAPLGQAPEMAALAAGGRPGGLSDAAFATYGRALAALAAAKVSAGDVAAIAAFTTDDPTAQTKVVRDAILADPPPSPDAPWTANEVFDDYCVYSTTIAMPDYQAGDPPYDFDSAGGGWAFDASGKPIVQRREEAHLVVTIPRAPMPANGYPTAVFVRTGGGGDRPLVDRGPQATNGGPAIAPGTGPALHFAKVGFAGVEVDGPHGGLRNLTGKDEQFLMFNIFNGEALRDNVRESAVELVLLAHVLDALTLDASACPGAATPRAKLDTTKLALMGHSMGATIAPLTLAMEPRFGAAVLDGAGASWIQNVVFKQKPVAVGPAIALFIGFARERRDLLASDPVLTLFQWAEEPADPLVYTRSIVREPPPGAAARHVLMEQGIVDHYIMPPIADAMSLSLGLDLAGDALDAKTPEVASLEPIESVLPYAGRSKIALPASANETGGVTAIVVQHPEDGIEDGHEITFQTDPPKNEYRCFLKGYAAGVAPVVPKGASADAPCP